MSIIQHGKETKHAKNTAKLAKLCASSIEIVRADSTGAMQQLATSCHLNSSAVIYPCSHSLDLETHKEAFAQNINSLIIIDGSWKQAFSIFQQNEWLRALPAFHFEMAPASEYSIRHTRFSKSLSTLEALAYTLSTVYNIEVEPFYRLQRAMQNKWQGPDTHRRPSIS